MKTLKTKLVALCAFSLVLYSCSKDSGNTNPTTTTVIQDKQNITKTIDDFYSCLNTLNDGDMSNFMLYSLFNGTNQQYNDSWIKKLSNKFELQYGKIILSNQFQFANRTGIYTWDKLSQSWTKQDNSNVITLLFPSKETQPTIDSELSLNSFSDINTSFNAKTYYLPNAASLTLKRNNVLQFSINLTNVTFQTGTNFSMPLNADITIFTSPFTHTFQWRRISSTEFQLAYNSNTTQGCGTSVVTNFKLYDADYANITSVKDDLRTINGTFTEGNLKIVYTVDVQTLSTYTDPTPDQINSNSDAEVFYNNAKIGDLSYKKINNKTEIFIIYSDGTSENVNTYVSDFETKVRTIFASYLN